MALDAFMAYVGVYSSVDAAKADYDAVHDLHTSLDAGETGLVVVGVSDMTRNQGPWPRPTPRRSRRTPVES